MTESCRLRHLPHRRRRRSRSIRTAYPSYLFTRQRLSSKRLSWRSPGTGIRCRLISPPNMIVAEAINVCRSAAFGVPR